MSDLTAALLRSALALAVARLGAEETERLAGEGLRERELFVEIAEACDDRLLCTGPCGNVLVPRAALSAATTAELSVGRRLRASCVPSARPGVAFLAVDAGPAEAGWSSVAPRRARGGRGRTAPPGGDGKRKPGGDVTAPRHR